MSDFADGIAPQRYYCKRRATCQQRNQCKSAQTIRQPYNDNVSGTAHWSLDEGRWKISPGGPSAPSNALAGPPPETNAFIGFKRFVDRSWDGLISGRTQRSQAEIKQQPEQGAWLRWTGNAVEPETITTQPASSEAREAARLLLRQAELLTLDVPSQAIQALFQEDPPDYASRPESMANAMLAFGGACYFLPEIGDKLPSSKSLFRPAPLPPRWLSIAWFQQSQYSPLNVEADDSLPGFIGKWRNAFEDLMSVALDRPMSPSASFSSETRRFFGYEQIPFPLEPGIDWVLGLQTRGVLPPLLPRVLSKRQVPEASGLSFHGGKKDFDQLVDAIERSGRATSILLLSRQAAKLSPFPISTTDHNTSSPDGPPSSDLPKITTLENAGARLDSLTQKISPCAAESEPRLPTSPKNFSKSASLLSVQTTSKTSRTVDGKVSTKTVVRRKYNDGTEEEWETLHSAPDSPISDY